MKLCRTCRYGNEYELDKPCIVYREDCPLYQKEGDAMNREEAIKILENERDNHINGCNGVFYETRTEAVNMAIQALEHPERNVVAVVPCGDTISRQAVIDITWEEPSYTDALNVLTEVRDKVESLPSVNPQEPKWNMLLNWLNDMRFGIAPDETVTDIDELHCREAQTDILDEIMEWMKKQTPKSKCLLSQKYRDWQFIQEPKTGHWIDCDYPWFRCSECGALREHKSFLEYYCPNCGCRMVEPKESDHKCHTCKHYTSGEYDGSCDSYICEHYSGWESDNCN